MANDLLLRVIGSDQHILRSIKHCWPALHVSHHFQLLRHDRDQLSTKSLYNYIVQRKDDAISISQQDFDLHTTWCRLLNNFKMRPDNREDSSSSSAIRNTNKWRDFLRKYINHGECKPLTWEESADDGRLPLLSASPDQLKCPNLNQQVRCIESST